MAPLGSSSPSSVAARRIHATARQLQPPQTAALASTVTSFPKTHKIEPVGDTPYFMDNQFV